MPGAMLLSAVAVANVIAIGPRELVETGTGVSDRAAIVFGLAWLGGAILCLALAVFVGSRWGSARHAIALAVLSAICWIGLGYNAVAWLSALAAGFG